VDIDDFIDVEINAFQIMLVVVENQEEDLLEDGYSEES
jgi:hypothetical protein